MPIDLREDVAYILLKKIDESGDGNQHEVNLDAGDFAGRQVNEADIIAHLDYLNQKQYIDADFGKDAYGGADIPSPEIAFKQAALTDRGRKLLEKMKENPPKSLGKGPAVPIASKNMPFLEKVMIKGELEDIFDARDLSEVVFRVMRDLMTTEEIDRVASELHKEAEPTKDKALQNEIAELWNDTNPIVAWISRIRQPLRGPAPLGIDDTLFLTRVRQEGGVQPSVNAETVVQAVFAATKDELSEERIREIAEVLPGKVRQLWEQAQ